MLFNLYFSKKPKTKKPYNAYYEYNNTIIKVF